MHLADALGYQLAEDDRQHRDAHDHQTGSDDVGHRGRHHGQYVSEPLRQRLGEGRLTHNAVEHTDRGDADLHRGEKLCGPLRQRHGGPGTGIATLHHDLQPCLAAGSQRHLGHGEQAVEQDEKDEKRCVHDGQGTCGNHHQPVAVTGPSRQLKGRQRSRINS
jgi:hypothetical protein